MFPKVVYKLNKNNDINSSRYDFNKNLFFDDYIYDIDYAPVDKNRQKLLLSSRDWETLATEYVYNEFDIN